MRISGVWFLAITLLTLLTKLSHIYYKPNTKSRSIKSYIKRGPPKQQENKIRNG